MADARFQEWIATSPLNTPVELYGEKFFLNVLDGGAELGAYFLDTYNSAQLETALQMGFVSATRYQAGLATDKSGRALVLTRWLPGVRSWHQAARQVEELWSQLDAWREAADISTQNKPVPVIASRAEMRMRSLLQAKAF